MLPLMVDAERVRILAVGSGEALRRRLERLEEAGARDVTVTAEPPTEAALAGVRLVFVAGLPTAAARDVARVARAAGALVHVEDVPEISDLHAPSTVRRGELTIAVSTNGRSPALARRVRRWIEQHLGEEWQARVDEIGELRRYWRAAGARPDEVARWTDDWIDRTRLLEQQNAGERRLAWR
jgi:precorrin-2 dehydrogenase/sirohydrochlorin ferrochelatase